MTRNDLQLIILNWFVANSGLKRNHVRFADQRGDDPDTPFGTIKLIAGPKALGHDETRVPDPIVDAAVTDDFLVSGQRRVLVSLHIFSSLDPDTGIDSPGAIQMMSNVRDSLERPTVFNDLFSQGISVNDRPGDVQNLTALLEDVFREHAQLDIHFGYASNIGDSPGRIDKVSVGGTVSGAVNVPGTISVAPVTEQKP